MKATGWVKPKFYTGITVDLLNKTRYILQDNEILVIESNHIEIINELTKEIVAIPSIQVLAIQYTKKV